MDRSPLYERVMQRIQQLMLLDPKRESPDGEELSLLADLAVFYERGIMPSSAAAESPARGVKRRLAFMAEGIRAQQGFNWDEYELLCRDSLEEFEKMEARLALVNRWCQESVLAIAQLRGHRHCVGAAARNLQRHLPVKACLRFKRIALPDRTITALRQATHGI